MSEVKTYEMEILTRKEENLKPLKIFGYENKVWISGKIEKEFEFDHEWHDEKFYTTRVMVDRLSGTVDYIPIIVAEHLIPDISLKGKIVEIGGKFNSYREVDEDGKRHFMLFVLANVMKIHESKEELDDDMNINAVFLQGEILKKPIFRVTSKGRCITEILLKVNRGKNMKFSYIPCIAWGKWATYLKDLNGSSKYIKVYGRIQSREDSKKEDKVYYELSISNIKEVDGLFVESDGM